MPYLPLLVGLLVLLSLVPSLPSTFCDYGQPPEYPPKVLLLLQASLLLSSPLLFFFFPLRPLLPIAYLPSYILPFSSPSPPPPSLPPTLPASIPFQAFTFILILPLPCFLPDLTRAVLVASRLIIYKIVSSLIASPL